jgi:hypothetical protein
VEVDFILLARSVDFSTQVHRSWDFLSSNSLCIGPIVPFGKGGRLYCPEAIFPHSVMKKRGH